ncbi:MAG: tetratricopeptide repeat protein [Gammaproteobacteria bacterium]
MISRQAQDIYLRAAEQAPERRHTFVADSCGDDTALKEEVLSLLAVAGDADDYFDSLSGRIGLAALASDDERVPSEPIGPWRLIRLLGRGGMGAVYLAERIDDQYEHQVALKLLPIGVATDQARARFLSERQILARLVHDNVARLLDGGVTDDGSPWFVMDYVDGVPIDEYCNTHQLDVRARLRLLLDVADAVQYAHGSLIVHRDLKPGNVLVEAGGRVRLLDFGIAKVLEPQGNDSSLTQLAQRPVTPAFASPEMLRGDPVDVTTDVYSLGVLMYLLLAERLPLSYEGMTLTAMHEHAATSAPIAIGQIDRALSGDLEAIVTQALGKTPGERYRSVESFAADIRCYLNDMPVSAKAPSNYYRARKFASRHRFGLAFAAFAVVSLATLAGGAVYSAVKSRQQAQQIALERDKAEHTKAFLLSIFEVSGPNQSRGESITALELLDAGTQRIKRELADQPAVRAELTQAIAQVYFELSAFDKAEPLFEEAGELWRDLSNADLAIAQILEKRASIADRRGDFEMAEELASEAVFAHRALSNGDDLAGALVTLGRIRQRRGESEDAEALFREALSRHRELHGTDHPSVARDLTHLGAVLMQRGDYVQAESVIRQGIAIRREVYGDVHTSLIDSLHNLAQVLNFQSRHDEARVQIEWALDISETLLPDGDSNAFYLWSALADTHRKMGDLDLAERHFRTSLDVLRRHYEAEHPETAMVLAQLGRIALQRGDAAAAEPLLREGIGMVQRANPGHPFLPDMRITLGQSLMQLARYEQAAKIIEQSFASLAENLGSEHPRTQFAVKNLVALYEASGDSSRAEFYRVKQSTER